MYKQMEETPTPSLQKRLRKPNHTIRKSLEMQFLKKHDSFLCLLYFWTELKLREG